MPKYMVTFSGMDYEADANPFWHTFLLLSVYNDITKQIEVVDQGGFYGPTATVKKGATYALKRTLGFDTDLEENHRFLMHEALRDMDRGKGLHGVTFELTAEKFTLLKKRLEKLREDQAAAVTDAAQELKLDMKRVGKPRCYDGEQHSLKIFQHEAKRAEPRLKEFSLNLLGSPKTCKTHAISMLDGILTPAQIERIKGGKSTITRFSGKMETIHLHSEGPLQLFAKKGTYFRDFNYDAKGQKDSETRLLWTVPPQEIETISKDIKELFHVDTRYVDRVKKVVRELQSLEIAIRNFKGSSLFHRVQNELLDDIKMHYKYFSIARSDAKKELPPTQQTWRSAFSSFWSTVKNNGRVAAPVDMKDHKHAVTQVDNCVTQPDFWRSLSLNPSSDPVDREFLDHLIAAEDFLANLHAAVRDDWEEGVTESLTDKDLRKFSVDDPYCELFKRYTPAMKQQVLEAYNNNVLNHLPFYAMIMKKVMTIPDMQNTDWGKPPYEENLQYVAQLFNESNDELDEKAVPRMSM